MKLCIRTSYGNDSVALIKFVHEAGFRNVVCLYNDTGWARPGWMERVSGAEQWARSLGFETARTASEGMLPLVRRKKAWPRQGMQFCTQELKIGPTQRWLREVDPELQFISVIGVRREESERRKKFPEFQHDACGRRLWAPLVRHTAAMRDELLFRAGVQPLPHRSKECYPCVNSNRPDLLQLTEDRISEIEAEEKSLGFTSKGKPRTMFRPYNYMGATGIREMIRWANSERGKFSLDDGNGAPGCEAGYCGG